MTNSWKIDDRDLTILRALFNNPREKIGAIASDLGISATAVTKRIEILKKNGLITGTKMQIAWETLGFSTTAVLVAKTEYSYKSEILETIKKRAIERDGLVLSTCQSGIGHYDILVGIHAKDRYVLDEMRRFIEGLPGVKKTALFIWLDIYRLRNLDKLFKNPM
jgi:DNA-binding Lrp family transcriptional regulator